MIRLLFFSVFVGSVALSSFSQGLARGADVGWLSEMEQSGRVWHDSNGVQKDLFDILPDYCINAIRLRVWVNPAGGWSGKQDVINVAKRAVDKGYRLMIDFHYSDSWADPGQQTKPAAWNNYSVTELAQAVYDHTEEVLSALKEEGVTPEWVQVGNETNDGMLWPEGKASGNNNANMANYANFVDRGYAAVKEVFSTAKVIVHVSNGYNNELFRWNIGGLVANGARFDVVALSMYPDNTTPTWQQYAQEALANMQDMISRYGKEVMVAEIGLPTNQPQEGRQFVEQIIQNLESIDNNRALGVFWWEPQAYDWRGYGKVAWNGNTAINAYQATDAMKGFQYNCSFTPTDCHGEENGSAFVDNCGQCVGGNTGIEACTPVEVTFKVDMSGQDVANGVYLTGTITETGGNWQIVPMVHEGNNVYAYSLDLYPGDTGAYYFLNANDWAARESVPSECVIYWQDRGFTVPQSDVTFNHVWASCDELVTGMNASTDNHLRLFPNPFETSVVLQAEHTVDYSIINNQGTEVEQGRCESQCDIGIDILSGVYLLQIQTDDGVLIRQIVKK